MLDEPERNGILVTHNKYYIQQKNRELKNILIGVIIINTVNLTGRLTKGSRIKVFNKWNSKRNIYSSYRQRANKRSERAMRS